MNLPVIELTNNGAQAQRLTALALSSRHRSIYLPLLRGLTPNSLAVFDFAEQGMVTGDRDTTTVAPQALYLLNDPFVRSQSRALADRLLAAAEIGRRAADRFGLSPGVRPPGDNRRNGPRSTVSRRLRRRREGNAARGAGRQRSGGRSRGKSGPRQSSKAANPQSRRQIASAADCRLAPDRNPKPESHSVSETSDPRTAAWISFCQVLFDAAEFRYLK